MDGILGFFINVLTNINTIFYLLAYFIGAIPFGFLILKWGFGINLLQVGSGSIGATNVFRALKEITPRAKMLSILTIILDSSKGLIIVLAAKIAGLSFEAQWAIVVLCVLGHCYSPYLNFRGGKGVATSIGATLLLIPIESLLGLLVWFIVGKVFKVSSISSLIGVSCGILLTFIIPPINENISIVSQINTHAPLILLLILIIYTHIPNIIRLIKKQEGKIL